MRPGLVGQTFWANEDTTRDVDEAEGSGGEGIPNEEDEEPAVAVRR